MKTLVLFIQKNKNIQQNEKWLFELFHKNTILLLLLALIWN